MTINQNELLMQPGKGASYWFDRDLYTFKAVSEDTSEAYALFEVVVAPQGGGTPPHRHSRENESFYILERKFPFDKKLQPMQWER